MKMAVYGAGSLGTILGALLTKNGYDIDLIDVNEAHVKALMKREPKL
jgi:2-dehydropantoate 2-reductase